jgi:hypothetical protein
MGTRSVYTFMPRERNEGYGDVNAIMTKYNTNPQNTLKSHLAMGYFDLPTLKRLN